MAAHATENRHVNFPFSINPLKGEYFIPSVASDLLHDGKASLEVLVSKDQWYGVTYPEDKQSVIDALAALRESGTYKF